MVNIGNDWDGLLKNEFSKEYYMELRRFLIEEYNNFNIYPSMYDIFNAFKFTPYSKVKVVIIGQDPYYGFGQAHGLCFSVKKGVKMPPSLKNIFKELEDDMGIPMPPHGNLEDWAKKGVLLLNTVLTVREGHANSHKDKGWERLTDQVIKMLDRREKPLVFMLWGAQAKAKSALIKNPKHLILAAAHPSPLSAFNGFFGCRHFSEANIFLKDHSGEIDWKISDW